MKARRTFQAFGAATAFIVLVSVFGLLGCGGKKEVKQVSQESKTAQEAFALAEGIREAYVKKDFSSLQNLSTREGYKDIANTIKHFDAVNLAFTPKWVEIERSQVHLNIAWKGTWTVSGETFRERGMAVFLLEGKPLKLGKIVRGNPFKYPER